MLHPPEFIDARVRLPPSSGLTMASLSPSLLCGCKHLTARGMVLCSGDLRVWGEVSSLLLLKGSPEDRMLGNSGSTGDAELCGARCGSCSGWLCEC